MFPFLSVDGCEPPFLVGTWHRDVWFKTVTGTELKAFLISNEMLDFRFYRETAVLAAPKSLCKKRKWE